MYRRIIQRTLFFAVIMCLISQLFSPALFVNQAQAAGTNKVNLLYASVKQTCDTCYSFQGAVEVENLAYQKKVTVVYNAGNQGWKEFQAQYLGKTEGNLEAWTFKLENPDFANKRIQFAIKYEVNGQTYWDNNNGYNTDFHIGLGPDVTVPSVVLRKSRLITGDYSASDEGLKGQVHLLNIAYQKEVKIVYSTDGWATRKEALAKYDGKLPGSSNIETWSFQIGLPESVQKAEFAVAYKVNGVTYWDNNLKQNYKAVISPYTLKAVQTLRAKVEALLQEINQNDSMRNDADKLRRLEEALNAYNEAIKAEEEANYQEALRLLNEAWSLMSAIKAELNTAAAAVQRLKDHPTGDGDGDGLTNGFELDKLRSTASPFKQDSDNNGISDANEDFDEDGLTNLQEQTLGTDPLLDDTDGDGLTDGIEVQFGTDPLQADSDGNGVADGQETYEQTFTEPATGAEVEVIADGDISPYIYVTDASQMVVTEAVYAMGPMIEIDTEKEFDKATITIPVDEAKLAGRDIQNVKMAYFDEEKMTFVPLDVQGVDAENGIVWGETDHFSLYTLFYIPNLSSIWQVPFHAGERGTSTEMTFIDVMLIIDSSGSMDWNDPTDIRKTAAKNFIDGLIPGSRVGVVVGDRAGLVDFDDRAKLVHPLTDNYAAVKSSIETIDSVGGTDIGAGVDVANQELIDNSDDERIKVEILLTDGEGDYSSAHTQEAIANGITIYTIGLGSSVDEALLKNIAGSTGGQYFHASDASELPIVYDRIKEIVTEPEDTDKDGIPDSVEIKGMRVGSKYGSLIFTDPNNPDTDGDGLNDGEEIGAAHKITLFGTEHSFYPMYSNPTEADSDGDGLTDYEERKVYNSEPLSKDSDYDGLDDYFEVHHRYSDDIDLQTEGSGGDVQILSSGAPSYIYSSDPKKRDTDGDGLTDFVEKNDKRYHPSIPDVIIKKSYEYTIRSTATWLNRIHVYAPVYVPTGSTLTIKPKTKVISYLPNDTSTLLIQGTLNAEAEGTLNDRIYFTYGNKKTDANDKYWRGIVAVENSELNIDNVGILDAYGALTLYGGATLNASNTLIYRSAAAVAVPEVAAGYIAYGTDGTADISIDGMDISSSDTGMNFKNAVYAYIANTKLTKAGIKIHSNLDFSSVVLDNVSIDYQKKSGSTGVAVYNKAEVDMYNLTVRNAETGIYASNSWAHNTIVNVSASTIADNGVGIKVSDAMVQYGDDVAFIRNGKNVVQEKAGALFLFGVAQGVVAEIGGSIYYLLPDLFAFAQAIANEAVTLKSIKNALGSTWNEYEDSFNNLYYNSGKVLSGASTMGESKQYGRDLVRGIEAISVAGAATKLSIKGLRNTVDAVKKHKIDCNCFTAGTKVQTDQGEKPIEEIEVGDKVLSKDDETGEIAYKEVEWLFQRDVEETYNITVGEEVITTTDEHPFWIVGKGWVEAQHLVVGDVLTTSDGKELAIEKIDVKQEHATVYNFKVKEFHTYFVSSLGIWTHNKCNLGPGKVVFTGDGVKHVEQRHIGNVSGWENKSKWTVTGGYWRTYSRDTIKSADRVSMDGDRFVYEKQFNKVMGVDANGNNLYKVRVVVDKNGYLVTSFPQADWK
ncbi:hypothetical protein PAECIP111893_04938 [Paenibacillus plantiphilus]|uniref:Uncharacterized protein n=1 Tax=Paenibacillus plantiphilus TaxID=2905650 RepID=A0ABN8H0Y4_9BACL|nr:polymorphic toxin-type HINT domain-containing protein [Paenibacillus plantiphilus]CAH1223239.1 hypothetical protein PAECIP111893_04938 [Paenibacillus plantiphilus]